MQQEDKICCLTLVTSLVILLKLNQFIAFVKQRIEFELVCKVEEVQKILMRKYEFRRFNRADEV